MSEIQPLVGRDAVVHQVAEAATDASGPPIQLVQGEVGAGRTAALEAVGEHARSIGTPVHVLSCLPGDRMTAFLLVHRLITAVHTSATADRLLGEAFHSHHDTPDPARAMSLVLAKALHHPGLRQRGLSLVLVDDAQFADPESLELIRSLAPALGSSALRLVLSTSPLTLAWPSTGTAVIRAVDLPPLGQPDVARLLADRLGPLPEPELVDRLHRISGGNPAALDAALRLGAAQVKHPVVEHAHLITGAPDPVLPDDDRFLRALRGLGTTAWRVSKALSLLFPMGTRAARLIAEATGLSVDTVHGTLRQLTDTGIVVTTCARSGGLVPDSGWRFRIPLVSVAVTTRLGPYERRVCSAVAVRSLWETGDSKPGGWIARLEDEHDRTNVLAYLASRIVDAGPLLDRRRAAEELHFAASSMHHSYASQAVCWLRTAAHMTDDPVQRAAVLAESVSSTYCAGDYEQAAEASGALLRDHSRELGPAARQELAVVERLALSAVGRLDALETVSSREHTKRPHTHGGPVADVITLCQLGQWSQALELITKTSLDTDPDPVTRSFSRTYKAAAMLIGGDSADFHESLRHSRDAPVPAYLTLELIIQKCGYLLGLGDLDRARDLLQEHGTETEELPPQGRFLLHFLSGDWDAGMAAMRSVPDDTSPTSRLPLSLLMHSRAAAVLLARGRPSEARSVLDTARTSPMSYLLEAEDAAIHELTGDLELAERTLCKGLTEALEHGYVFGTDALWAALAPLHARRGRPDRAAHCLAELRRAAESLNSDHTRLLYARSCLDALRHCPALRTELPAVSACLQEALSLARSSGRPFDTARTLLSVASCQLSAVPDGNELLEEAYDLFDRLGAPLWRYRTRAALRDAGIPVGRKAATEENDRLLSALVAEGLTNRQLAAALSLNEGSVASRLTRLFTRAGVRSRVELASVILAANRQGDVPRRNPSETR